MYFLHYLTTLYQQINSCWTSQVPNLFMIIYKPFHLSCTQQTDKQFQSGDARLPNDIR
jgi:hypothetical protein